MKTNTYHGTGRPCFTPSSRRQPFALSWRRRSRSVSLFFRPAWWILTAFFLALGLSIWIHGRIVRLSHAVDKVQRQHHELTQRQQNFSFQLERLRRPDSIQSMAGQRLGLAVPTKGQVRKVEIAR